MIEPHCVEVTVRTDGAEETAQVGVGAPCEGQQPPPEPTDPWATTADVGQQIGRLVQPTPAWEAFCPVHPSGFAQLLPA